MHNDPAPPHRYEELAAKLTGLVDAGILKVGMKAPSLRAVSEQNRVSLSTAIQAYRVLEDRGILEAKPKSGFYIARSAAPAREGPSRSSPPARPSPVAVSTGVAEILEHAANPAYAPLGCAIPSAKILDAQALDRHLARCARTLGREYNIYTDPRGDMDLRQQISERGIRLGQELAPDTLVVTCGCTEALAVALTATTKPGDTVAIESPTYFGLLQVLEARGLKALELPTHPTKGIDLERLRKAVETGRVSACLLSSSFNNPLGCLMSEERKRAIIELLSRHQVPLIEDDIYGDIYFGPSRPRPFAALAPEADILTCSSFSKTVAPGYRIGWISSSGRFKAILEAKFASSLCGPALPQKAMADFLRTGGYDKHLRRIRRHFADNISRMSQAIDRSFPEATRMSSPQGGFVLWLELPKGFDCAELYRRAIAERICFAPGWLFSASSQYANCLRLSCGHEWSPALERSVERLGAMAHELLEA